MLAVLLYVCAAAGFIMVVGNLYLIAKQRVYIDSQTRDVTDIELPFGIKMKTNTPIIVMFLFGAALLAFPVWEATRHEEKKNRSIFLSGNIESSEPVKVTVIIADRSDVTGTFNVEVPLTSANYTVTYTIRNGTSLIAREEVLLSDDEKDSVKKLRDVKAQIERQAANVIATLSQPTRTESASALSEFK